MQGDSEQGNIPSPLLQNYPGIENTLQQSTNVFQTYNADDFRVWKTLVFLDGCFQHPERIIIALYYQISRSSDSIIYYRAQIFTLHAECSILPIWYDFLANNDFFADI